MNSLKKLEFVRVSESAVWDTFLPRIRVRVSRSAAGKIFKFLELNFISNMNSLKKIGVRTSLRKSFLGYLLTPGLGLGLADPLLEKSSNSSNLILFLI